METLNEYILIKKKKNEMIIKHIVIKRNNFLNE